MLDLDKKAVKEEQNRNRAELRTVLHSRLTTDFHWPIISYRIQFIQRPGKHSEALDTQIFSF